MEEKRESEAKIWPASKERSILASENSHFPLVILGHSRYLDVYTHHTSSQHLTYVFFLSLPPPTSSHSCSSSNTEPLQQTKQHSKSNTTRNNKNAQQYNTKQYTILYYTIAVIATSADTHTQPTKLVQISRYNIYNQRQQPRRRRETLHNNNNNNNKTAQKGNRSVHTNQVHSKIWCVCGTLCDICTCCIYALLYLYRSRKNSFVLFPFLFFFGVAVSCVDKFW
jgi:hypothetical protein